MSLDGVYDTLKNLSNDFQNFDLIRMEGDIPADSFKREKGIKPAVIILSSNSKVIGCPRNDNSTLIKILFLIIVLLIVSNIFFIMKNKK
jgi:hypothetical protein